MAIDMDEETKEVVTEAQSEEKGKDTNKSKKERKFPQYLALGIAIFMCINLLLTNYLNYDSLAPWLPPIAGFMSFVIVVLIKKRFKLNAWKIIQNTSVIIVISTLTITTVFLIIDHYTDKKLWLLIKPSFLSTDPRPNKRWENTWICNQTESPKIKGVLQVNQTHDSIYNALYISPYYTVHILSGTIINDTIYKGEWTNIAKKTNGNFKFQLINTHQAIGYYSKGSSTEEWQIEKISDSQEIEQILRSILKRLEANSPPKPIHTKEKMIDEIINQTGIK